MLQFVCTQCGCLDLIELAHDGVLPPEPAEQLCTLCKTGEWHEAFARQTYDPETDQVANRPSGISLI